MQKKKLLLTLFLCALLALGLSFSVYAADTDPAEPPGQGEETPSDPANPGEEPSEPADPAEFNGAITADWITLSEAAYVYDGAVKTPEVTVTSPVGETLTAGEDYTLIRTSGRKEPGVYAAIVTGSGEYSGTAVKLFTIEPAAVMGLSATVNGSTEIALTWNAVKGATGYNVYVRTAEEEAYASYTSCVGTSFTASALTPKTDYAFRVEAVYVSEADGVFLRGEGAETTAKTASGTQANFEVTVKPTTSVYNGTIRTPDVAVTNEAGETLAVSTDYTSAMESGRIEPGVYSVIVTGRGAYKGTVETSFRVVPAAPTNLTATATAANEILLRWTASHGATAYEVLAAAGEEEAVSLGLTEETSYVAADLTAETTYTFTVIPRAVVERGTLIGEAARASRKAQDKPAAPAELTAEASLGKAVLTWTAAEYAAKYNVYMLNAETEEFELKTTVTGTTCTITGLENDVDYTFRVKTVREEEGLTLESDGYAECEVTPFMTAPDVPENIKAAGEMTAITLTWDTSYGATQYNIYRYNGTKKAYVYIGTSYGRSYTAKSLSCGTTYYFRIVPVRKADGMTWVGAYSDAVSAKTGTDNLKMQNFNVQKDGSYYVLSWNKNTLCTQYNIYIDGSYSTTVYTNSYRYYSASSSHRFAVDPVRKDGSTWVGPRTEWIRRQTYSTGTPRLYYKVLVKKSTDSYITLNYAPADHYPITETTTVQTGSRKNGYYGDLRQRAAGCSYTTYSGGYINGTYYSTRYYGYYYDLTTKTTTIAAGCGADAYYVEFWADGECKASAITETANVSLTGLNLEAGTYQVRIYGYNYLTSGGRQGGGYYSDTLTIE